MLLETGRVGRPGDFPARRATRNTDSPHTSPSPSTPPPSTPSPTTVFDSGWQDVAETVLAFIKANR